MSIIVDPTFLNPTISSALRLLLQNHEFAASLSCYEWEFAVPIRQLRATGCTDNTLRFMLRAQYVEHQLELQRKQPRR